MLSADKDAQTPDLLAIAGDGVVVQSPSKSAFVFRKLNAQLYDNQHGCSYRNVA